MPANAESGTRKQTPSKVEGFREQAILTVKILLITGGALGLLALLEWIVVS